MRPSSTAALLSVFIGLVGLLAYDAIVGTMALAREAGAPMQILAQLLFLGLPAFMYYRANPEQRPAMRLDSIDAGTAALVALSALAGTFALNNLAAFWHAALRAFGFSVRHEGVPAQTGVQLAQLLLAAALAPALFEEFLFRGFLLPSLEPFGSRWAVLVSGALFALLHGRIETLPAHIMLGLLLSCLVLRTNSIWTAILYHALHNAAIIVAAFFANIFPGLMPVWQPDSVLRLVSVTAALLAVWTGLLYCVVWRGGRRRKPALPPAAPVRMPALSVILLSACMIMLLVAQFASLHGIAEVSGL